MHRPDVRKDVEESLHRARLSDGRYTLVVLPACDCEASMVRRNDGSRLRLDIKRGSKQHGWLEELYREEASTHRNLRLEFGGESKKTVIDGEGAPQEVFMPTVTFMVSGR